MYLYIAVFILIVVVIFIENPVAELFVHEPFHCSPLLLLPSSHRVARAPIRGRETNPPAAVAIAKVASNVVYRVQATAAVITAVVPEQPISATIVAVLEIT